MPSCSKPTQPNATSTSSPSQLPLRRLLPLHDHQRRPHEPTKHVRSLDHQNPPHLLSRHNPRDTPEITPSLPPPPLFFLSFFPLFSPSFFEAPGSEADIAAIAEALEFGRKVFDSSAPLGPFKEAAPCKDGSRTCCVHDHVLAQAWSHHATSSCAIGADGDAMAALDSKFRVRGVTGPRVVDASAFPRVPGSFPVIPTFISSIKASEDIFLGA